MAGRCRQVRGMSAGGAASALVNSRQVANARWNMSLKNAPRPPPCTMMASCSSRHSGWSAMMPRSRQISTSTAPTGRRRISAAICSGVGRRARRGSGGAAGSASRRAARGARCDGARGGRGFGSGRAALRRSLASSASARSRASGDARQDQRDVACAEAGRGAGGAVGEAALADRGGEVLAVVDELADEAEQAGEVAAPVGARRPGGGLGGWVRGVGCGGHERNKGMNGRRVARNIFR